MATVYFCLGNSRDLALRMVKKKVAQENIVEFGDGEIWVEYSGKVMGKEVVCIQLLQGEINRCLVSLLLFLEAVKYAGAKKITLVFPYFFYGRQDRKFSNGVCSVASRWLAKALENVGVDKLIVVDLHAPDVINFFSAAEVVNLGTIDVFSPHLNIESGDVVVSPDNGGMDRASDYADKFGAEFAFVQKQRLKNGLIFNIVRGDVKGKRCFVVDDILGSGATLFGVAKLLKNAGAKYVALVVTHAVFCGNAMDNLRELMKEGVIDRVVVSNSIPREFGDLLEVVDISKLLANAI